MARSDGQRGISLVETLVALALGALVLATVLQVMSQLVGSNSATVQVSRLEQDVRTVTDNIVQELRRAGQNASAAQYLGDAAQLLQNQPTVLTIDGAAAQSGKSGSSIAYAYRDSDGKLVQSGFSFDAQAGAVQMRVGNTQESITDAGFMTISELTFTPQIVSVTAGSVQTQALAIEVRIAGRLKADSRVERRLSDRVVLRNVALISGTAGQP